MVTLSKIEITKLSGTDNYTTWTIRIFTLLVKDNLEFDNIPTNSKLPADFNLNTIPIAKNKKILAIIKLLYKNSPLLYIKNETNTIRIWQILRDIYNPKDFTTEYLILKQFFNILLADYDSIEIYLNKIKLLINNLISKNIILPNQIIIV